MKVKRHSESVLILKMVLDNSLMNVLTVYAAHSGKPEEERENFWNKLFHLVSCIPQNEMVVLVGDMNGHVGSNSVGYNGMHGGYRFGDRNADGSRILEFADGLNLVICNTLFMKQESKLVTYVAGAAKSTVDYIMVRQGDKVKVRSVKEEYLVNGKMLFIICPVYKKGDRLSWISNLYHTRGFASTLI